MERRFSNTTFSWIFLCYMACFFAYRKYKYMVMIYLVYQLDEYVGGDNRKYRKIIWKEGNR